jgi:hypothetical protein
MVVAILVVASLLIGLLIGRMLALIVPAVFFLTLYLLGRNDVSDSPDESGLIALAGAVGCGVFVLIGVALRRLADALRAPASE